ncbi:MAG TPA: HEAT repeat domain-containing protein [Polyangiaceae bacterium]|jgi:hypothetical protein|nr:HEAT repeat domain-containing protein [Polyangiaceae bacterium]
MIEELSALHRNAQSAAARGRLEEAILSWREAIQRTHSSEHDYLVVVRSLEEALTKHGDVRSALTLAVYLASHDPSARARADALAAHAPPADRAMVRASRGEWTRAAAEMETAGRWAAAAVLRERSSEWAAARALWSRLASQLARPAELADAYVAALVRFNLARCARRTGDAAGARESVVACVRLLEEAADHFESVGQRDRAFDCFQVLIEVGKDAGTFEDVLEGYVNCIRILREDHMRQFALDHFASAVDTAAECGELGAAATFAGEAAVYARSLELPHVSASWTLRQGELWVASSKQQAQRGAPVANVAHGLLAAIASFGQIGQYSRVGQLYTELGLLEFDARRRAHYARAARRYEDVADELLFGSKSDGARRHDAGASGANGATGVWHADVIEWEQQGNAAEACAEVMLDERWLDLVRRKAMLARLAALRAEAATPENRVTASMDLCRNLGELQNYAAMAPLEKLFASAEREVRIAAVDAAARLFFKRSFVIVRAALSDPDPSVAGHANAALGALWFPHAFDPLARIHRESASPIARAAALGAIAQIDTQEAAEFVMGILEHGPPTDRAAAARAVSTANGARFAELARQTLKHAPDPLRATLRELLAGGVRAA